MAAVFVFASAISTASAKFFHGQRAAQNHVVHKEIRRPHKAKRIRVGSITGQHGVQFLRPAPYRSFKRLRIIAHFRRDGAERGKSAFFHLLLPVENERVHLPCPGLVHLIGGNEPFRSDAARFRLGDLLEDETDLAGITLHEITHGVGSLMAIGAYEVGKGR